MIGALPVLMSFPGVVPFDLRLALVAVVGLAAAIDARTGKIPNVLTFPLMALGLVGQGLFGDLLGSVFGLGLMFGVHFPLWTVGVEKGGDAKLFMAVGALALWPTALEASAWTALVYLPVAVILLLVAGKLGNVAALARYRVWTALDAMSVEEQARIIGRLGVFSRILGERPLGKPQPTSLRTGPIIAVGTTLALYTDGLRFVG